MDNDQDENVHIYCEDRHGNIEKSMVGEYLLYCDYPMIHHSSKNTYILPCGQRLMTQHTKTRSGTLDNPLSNFKPNNTSGDE